MNLCCLCSWKEHGHPLSHVAVVAVVAVVDVVDAAVAVVVVGSSVGFHHSSQ